MERFGQWLNQQRTGRDLTQEELAERLGCSVSLLRKLEGNQRRPSKQLLQSLANLFGLDLAELEAWRMVTLAPPAATKPIPSHLPIALAPLVGRATALATLQELLDQHDIRLLTLTGPGGIGKTRLSLALGAACQNRFPGGVWFVALAAVQEASGVLPAIAQVMRLIVPPYETVLELLQRTLQQHPTMIILDNFEHLLAAAPDVATLLAGAPQLTVVCTSRALLQIPGERCWIVPPLSLVADPACANGQDTESAAVDLFLQRATAVNPHLVITEEILAASRMVCTHLEGLPLAIELAAARCQAILPTDLRTLFGSRLTLAKSNSYGLPPRHSNLWNALNWSYQLLDADTQRVFRALGVCVDGVLLPTLQAMLAEANESLLDLLDQLHLLVNHSLIRLEPTSLGSPAILMLETMREFASELLIQQGEHAPFSRRHADAYRAFLLDINSRISQADYTSWATQFDHEAANIERALHWLIDHDPLAAAQLASHLAPVWLNHGHIQHGGTWLVRCLAFAELEPLMRARLQRDLAAFWITAGRYGEVEASLRSALVIFEAANDELNCVRVQFMLATATMHQGHFAVAEHYLAQCEHWARANHQTVNVSIILHTQAKLLDLWGDYAAANAKVQAVLLLSHAVDDTSSIALGLIRQGFIALAQGAYMAAEDALRQAWLLLAQLVNYDRGEQADVHRLAGMLALERGEYQLAHTELGRAFSIATEVHDIPRVIQALDSCMLLMVRYGSLKITAALVGLEQRLRQQYAMPVPPNWLAYLAAIKAQLSAHLLADELAHWIDKGTAWDLEAAYQHIFESPRHIVLLGRSHA